MNEILDEEEALERKESALSSVQSTHAAWLVKARAAARTLAASNGTVTADDVRDVLYRRGLEPKHYNAWGAVFRHADFEFTGDFRRSAVPGGKGNMQRVWRLA